MVYSSPSQVLYLILAMCWAPIAFSQNYFETDPSENASLIFPHKITFSAGVSFPVGEFGKGEITNEGIKGYAQPGLHANLAFDMEVSNFIYISFGAFYNQNPVNAQAIIADLETDLPNSVHDFNATTYRTFSIMAGLAAGSNENRLDYMVKGRIGIYSMYLPEIYAFQTVGTQDRKVSQQEQIGLAIGLDFSAGLGYRILPWLGISAGFSYQLANIEFAKVLYTNSSGFGKRVNIQFSANAINVYGSLRFYLKK